MGFLNLIPRWVLLLAIVILCAVSGKLAVSMIDVELDLAKAKNLNAEMSVAIDKANTEAANKAVELRNQIIEAQNEAKKRETVLKVAANAAADESDGLRNDLEAMRVRLEQSTREAAIIRANAVSAVLQKCTREYIRMAETADRLNSDRILLMEAWPKDESLRHNTD